MRFWYDTEFYEDGERIHLISIAIVADARWNKEAWKFLQDYDEATGPQIW